MSTVGDKILYMRKQLGLTQEELARRMGYKSKSTINKIELGINDIPQSKIAQFADVLGTTPAHLMGWEEETKKNFPDELQLTEGEKKWLELYDRVSDETKDLAIKMLDAFDKINSDSQPMVVEMILAALRNQK